MSIDLPSDFDRAALFINAMIPYLSEIRLGFEPATSFVYHSKLNVVLPWWNINGHDVTNCSVLFDPKEDAAHSIKRASLKFQMPKPRILSILLHGEVFADRQGATRLGSLVTNDFGQPSPIFSSDAEPENAPPYYGLQINALYEKFPEYRKYFAVVSCRSGVKYVGSLNACVHEMITIPDIFDHSIKAIDPAIRGKANQEELERIVKKHTSKRK